MNIIKDLTFWVIVIIWIALIFIFYFYAKTPLLETITACITGFGVLIPLYCFAKNAKDDRDFKIIENTYALLSRWDDSHFAEARKFTRKIAKDNDKMSNNDKLAEIDKNENLKHSIILVLNYIQSIYMSIETKRVKEDIVKKYLDQAIVSIIDRFQCFIDRDFSETDKKILDNLRKKMKG